jgi:hypothetical protein
MVSICQTGRRREEGEKGRKGGREVGDRGGMEAMELEGYDLRLLACA